MTLQEAVALHLDPSRELRCIEAWRFTGHAKPGSRIDLRCQICASRISLRPASVDKVLALGYKVFCRECVADIEAECGQLMKRGEEIT